MKAHEKGLAFKVDLDSKLPEYLESDKTRIRQIIKNLLDNAIKFTEKGTVYLELKEQYKRANKYSFSIIIKDTGLGIKKEDQEKIFNRFNRLENAKNVALVRHFDDEDSEEFEMALNDSIWQLKLNLLPLELYFYRFKVELKT